MISLFSLLLIFILSNSLFDQIKFDNINKPSEINEQYNILNDLFDLGRFEEFKQYYSNWLSLDQKKEYSNQFQLKFSQFQARLSELGNFIKSQVQEEQTIEPCIEWAQNKTHVFVNVKLALRFSSPACINCEMISQNVENNIIKLFYQGITQYQPIKFKLDLELAKKTKDFKIEQSQGQVQFILAKDEEIIWEYLSGEKSFRVWWDMAQENQYYMDQWNELMDKKIQDEMEEGLKEYIEKNKKKDKKIKKRKDKTPKVEILDQDMVQIEQNEDKKDL